MDNAQKRKLNIAIVCDPITDYIAGSFVSSLRFAEILKSRGHKVVFIAAKSPKNNDCNDSYRGIKIYRFGSILVPKSEGQLYVSFPGKASLRKILIEEKIDLIHNIIPTPSSIITTRIARALGIKVVTHSHAQPENIFLHLPKMVPKGALNWAYYKFMYWLYNQADAIIYPTEFAQKLFPDLDKSLKTAVISNGVDIGRFKKVAVGDFFERYNLNRSEKHILHVGRFHPEKSIETLIVAAPKILQKYKGVHFVLVGSGHQEDYMKRLAKNLGIENEVTFLGRLSGEDLVLAYNMADIFVLPSLAELEGMVVLEAMACGNPLLIADSKGSASTYFVNGNGYLFRAEDSGDLAEKAAKMLNDEVLLERMSDKSLLDSRNYDIDRSVDKLLDLYYSLL